ncbi:MAG: hypothetical protein AAFP90_17340, partial [Planctomycetota bacterium]
MDPAGIVVSIVDEPLEDERAPIDLSLGGLNLQPRTSNLEPTRGQAATSNPTANSGTTASSAIPKIDSNAATSATTSVDQPTPKTSSTAQTRGAKKRNRPVRRAEAQAVRDALRDDDINVQVRRDWWPLNSPALRTAGWISAAMLLFCFLLSVLLVSLRAELQPPHADLSDSAGPTQLADDDPHVVAGSDIPQSGDNSEGPSVSSESVTQSDKTLSDSPQTPPDPGADPQKDTPDTVANHSTQIGAEDNDNNASPSANSTIGDADQDMSREDMARENMEGADTSDTVIAGNGDGQVDRDPEVDAAGDSSNDSLSDATTMVAENTADDDRATDETSPSDPDSESMTATGPDANDTSNPGSNQNVAGVRPNVNQPPNSDREREEQLRIVTALLREFQAGNGDSDNIDAAHPLTSAIAQIGDANQKRRFVQSLVDFASRSAAGSVEQWCSMCLAVRGLLCFGEVDKARSVAMALSLRFAGPGRDTAQNRTDASQILLQQILQIEPRSEMTLSHRESLLDANLELAEHLLRFEKFDATETLLRHSAATARSLPKPQMRSMLSDLDSTRDAMNITRRFHNQYAETIESVESNQRRMEDLDPRRCAKIGRYLCLQLRDWNRGLRWMTVSDDSDVSAIAAAE